MLDKSTLIGELKSATTVSAEEVARFDSLAKTWWDPNGKFKTALLFNETRLRYMLPAICDHFGRISQTERPLTDLSIVDVGSGGGLISEPLAQAGADVTGIDASSMSIEVARRHALLTNTELNYRHCLSSDLVAEGQQFDVVINAEVVEHVPDQQQLINECCQLVKPGGMLILATLNRTVKSMLVAIIGAEYVLKYLPKGTHDWNYFVKPSELTSMAECNNLTLMQETGMAFNPLSKKWRLTSDTSVNYIQCYFKESE